MNRTIGLISTNYTVSGYSELTAERPPASIPFGGRYRFLDFALSNMVNSRITTVGFITPYYYRSILDHMGAGKEWGLDKKNGGLFVLPGSVFGFKDAGGRFLLRDVLRNERYLQRGTEDYVLCCDCSLVYNADYQPMIAQHELEGKPVTFLYKKTDPRVRRRGWYLTLDESGRVAGLEQADAGEYLFLNCFLIDRTFFLRFLHDFRTLGYMDICEVLRMNLDSVHVGSFEFTGYVGFTDGIVDYVRSSMDLLNPAVRHELFSPDRQIYTKIHDEPPAVYVPGAKVRNSVISAGSIIEGTVENSILFREVRVEKGAVVRNCIIMEHDVVCSGAQLSWCVCDKLVSIGEGVTVTGTAEHPCILPKGKTI